MNRIQQRDDEQKNEMVVDRQNLGSRVDKLGHQSGNNDYHYGRTGDEESHLRRYYDQNHIRKIDDQDHVSSDSEQLHGGSDKEDNHYRESREQTDGMIDQWNLANRDGNTNQNHDLGNTEQSHDRGDVDLDHSRRDDVQIYVRESDEQNPEREEQNHNMNNDEQNSILYTRKTKVKSDISGKKDHLPTWAAAQSLLSDSSQERIQTNSEVIAPLFKTSPTDYATLFTVLSLTQGISALVMGPERKTIITLDLDLYSRALKVQQSCGNTNWVLCAGALHICFSYLHSLGKTVEASGVDTCAVDTGSYTSAALRGIFSGKAYKRAIEYHIVNYLAITMLQYDDLLADHDTKQVLRQSQNLRDALHDREPGAEDIFQDLEAWYNCHIKPLQKSEGYGESAQFLIEYMKQVDTLLNFITACRSRDFESFLGSLESMIKYFFAHDLLNYARLMPVYLGQMNELERTDPEIWKAFKDGDFVVTQSRVPFTAMFTDQALEHEIRDLKKHGGMVGLSQDEAALDRLITITPHLSRMVKQFLHGFPQSQKAKTDHDHYQLSGTTAVRVIQNAVKIRNSIRLHSTQNPFTVPSPLRTLTSSVVVPADAKEDILQYAKKGQERFEAFVEERLVPSSKSSVWDPMKRLKLKTFNTFMPKTKIALGEKVVKLREERELLGRFLIIQGSRPELVPKLEETIGRFEMSVVPRSLFANDGTLYIPTDKSSLMNKIKALTGPGNHSEDLPIILPITIRLKVMVIDAMPVVQCMKKSVHMKILSDLLLAFCRFIEDLTRGCCEVRVAFDHYLEISLKDKARGKRATTSKDYIPHPSQKLTMSLKDLLSSSKTKALLTPMLAESLLEYWKDKDSLLFVAYDFKIVSKHSVEVHSHEEADTLIPHQVLAASSEQEYRDITAWCPDTDVFNELMDLVARGRLPSRNTLKLAAAKKQTVDIVERVEVLGKRKALALIGLHNFTGADWGGKFIGISKNTWMKHFLKLDDNDPVLDCFARLGDQEIPTQLIAEELPPQLKPLEEFTCKVYSDHGFKSLPRLRWELFSTRNLEGESLPPTRAALLPHIMRVNYVCKRDKSYEMSCPTLPPIEESGWVLDGKKYMPIRCLELPAPKAVLELTKCACKAGCRRNCGCLKNHLPCTPLCKCYYAGCENPHRRSESHSEN